MQELRANTAVDVLIGPFVDDADGDTPITGSTLDVELSKNGQALANKTDATAPVHDAAGTVDGYYNCELDSTDTNTEGTLVLVVHHADSLPVRHDFMVLAEAAWDSKYVAKDDGFMDVNIKTIGRADTQETEADNLESAASNYSATRGLTGTALPAAAADAAGGVPVSDAGGLDLDTQIGTDIDAILVDTGTTLDGKIDTIDTNVDAILVDTGTTLDAALAVVDANVDAILVDTGTTLDAALAVVDANVDQIETAVITNAAGVDIAADIIAVKADTAAILTDTGTTLDGKIDTIDTNVDAVLVDTGTTLQAELDAIQAAVITNAAGADIAADIIAVKAETASILTDTGTTLQGELDGIQTDTEDIQSRIPAALASGRMSSDAVAISGSTDAADKLEASAETIVIGAAEAGTLSTTQMSTDLAEATDDHYNGRSLIWTSGVLIRQATDITGYVGVDGVLTFTAVTEAPSATDTFVIV